MGGQVLFVLKMERNIYGSIAMFLSVWLNMLRHWYAGWNDMAYELSRAKPALDSSR